MIWIHVSISIVLLLILYFFLARLAMLPFGLDSNVTKLLANLLNFIISRIVSSYLVSIKVIIIIIIILSLQICSKTSISTTNALL